MYAPFVAIREALIERDGRHMKILKQINFAKIREILIVRARAERTIIL